MLNYFFPPMRGGGVPRPVKMAKYLHRLGWTVTIVTVQATGEIDPHLDVGDAAAVVRVREWHLETLLRVLETSLRLWRHASEHLTARRSGRTGLLQQGFAFEEHEIAASKIGWVVPAVQAALRIHSQRRVDVAIASLPPGAAAAVGWALRRLAGIPYLVEYRDPWTVGAFWLADADGQPRSDFATRARFALSRRLEATLLQDSAGAVIVNGEAQVGELAATFPGQTRGKPIVQIRNGVDLEDTVPDTVTSPQRRIRLLHAGFFYHFHTPHHLIAALGIVQARHPEALSAVELQFLGDGFPERLVAEIARGGLSPLVRRKPPSSYTDTLAAMNEADGLIAVLPPLASDRDRIPTKLYEYLSTKRPILAIVDMNGATARLLEGIGDAIVADNTDHEAIAESLVAFIALVAERRRQPIPPSEEPRAKAHHYALRAGAMDALLTEVLGGTAGPRNSR
jgi:glycosyltransferase involved in cell wall biosynthesis